MAYTALYRKFRPLTFSEFVGQEHITKTLKNQIIAGRVGHAYLFNGGRGTGKTSAAKVLARAVNCLNPHDGEPCNECEICKGILNGSLTDVVEMDAASNNSVEDIRQIREEVNLERLSREEKGGRLDLQAKLEDGTIISIEMQLRNEYNIEERTTLYSGRNA